MTRWVPIAAAVANLASVVGEQLFFNQYYFIATKIANLRRQCKNTLNWYYFPLIYFNIFTFVFHNEHKLIRDIHCTSFVNGQVNFQLGF